MSKHEGFSFTAILSLSAFPFRCLQGHGTGTILKQVEQYAYDAMEEKSKCSVDTPWNEEEIEHMQELCQNILDRRKELMAKPMNFRSKSEINERARKLVRDAQEVFHDAKSTSLRARLRRPSRPSAASQADSLETDFEVTGIDSQGNAIVVCTVCQGNFRNQASATQMSFESVDHGHPPGLYTSSIDSASSTSTTASFDHTSHTVITDSESDLSRYSSSTTLASTTARSDNASFSDPNEFPILVPNTLVSS